MGGSTTVTSIAGYLLRQGASDLWGNEGLPNHNRPPATQDQSRLIPERIRPDYLVILPEEKKC